MGIFANHAGVYGAAGLRVFPCGGDDGKKPLISQWRKAATSNPTKLLERFPDANIGLIDGDRITRVDIDDPALIDGAIERFGDSPIKVETPSGGLHLWFRSSGERRAIGLEGHKIDILGKGGYGLAPPSIKPDSETPWRFIEGGVGDLSRLPTIKPGALPDARPGTPEGQRNNTLFKTLLRDLASGTDPDLIPIRAAAWNELSCDPPLPAAEVERCAMGAVKLHADGRNWVGMESHTVHTKWYVDSFSGNGDALMLMDILKFAFEGRVAAFPICAEAMARDATIPGWGLKRYRAATEALIRLGKIQRTHRGGKRRGDASQYRFN